jgi:hypothetical protein
MRRLGKIMLLGFCLSTVVHLLCILGATDIKDRTEHAERTAKILASWVVFAAPLGLLTLCFYAATIEQNTRPK